MGVDLRIEDISQQSTLAASLLLVVVQTDCGPEVGEHRLFEDA